MSCRTSIDLMNIRLARGSDAAVVGSVLQEAARWLAEAGQPLWSAAEISPERVQRDTDEGLFHIAWKDDQASNQAIGVIKIELEDVHFWPEIPPGTSVYIHKLAVRRCWANRGVSTALIRSGRSRMRGMRCRWFHRLASKGRTQPWLSPMAPVQLNEQG